MIIFNDARIKCQQKMEELNALKARDAAMDFLGESYSQELYEIRRVLEMKASQADSYKMRLNDMEQQIMKKDVSFAEQKRLITSIKDVHEEKFRVSSRSSEGNRKLPLLIFVGFGGKICDSKSSRCQDGRAHS